LDTALGGEEEEEDFKLDDDRHQMIDGLRLLPVITTPCLDGLSVDLIDSFGKLQESPGWPCAYTHRAQIALIVQALHYGSMKVNFSVIARKFGKLNGIIYKEYEKSQTQHQAPGRPSPLSEGQVEAIGVFALECFEKGTPATYEMIAHFIDSEMSAAISPDAVPHVMRRCPCFKIVTGIPMESESRGGLLGD
jgi:transposase